MSAHMQCILMRLFAILEAASPSLGAHVRKCGCEEMIFCYHWVVLLLKRELPLTEVPSLWEACWSSTDALGCEDFLLYACAAKLLRLEVRLLSDAHGLDGFMMCLKNDDMDGRTPSPVGGAAQLVKEAGALARAAGARPPAPPRRVQWEGVGAATRA